MALRPLSTAPKRFLKWLRELLQSFSQDRQPKSNQQQQRQPPEGNADSRYSVFDEQLQAVHHTDDLSSALDAWRDKTDQDGMIVDNETGEDITPERDDDGRYVVFDEHDEQLATFDDLADAEYYWEQETQRQGRIIDSQEKEDVTPYKGHLTAAQVEEAKRLADKLSGLQLPGMDRRVNVAVIKAAIEAINRMQLPIFDYANAIGSGANASTRTMTIKKRRGVVVPAMETHWVGMPIDEAPVEYRPTVEPTEHRERRRIVGFDEVTRVRPTDLVLPDFERRLARRELRVPEYHEEVPGDIPTVKVPFKRWGEKVEPEEWEEEVEVTDEERIQYLGVLCDFSGSMFYDDQPRNIEIAIAFCIVLITKHLHDESVYSFRWFATHVDDVVMGDDVKAKEDLIRFILRAEPILEIGGLTNINRAVHKGAGDVRLIILRSDDDDSIMELLIVTDGSDDVSAAELLDDLQDDVVLHTVVINGRNPDLELRSSTYHELYLG